MTELLERVEREENDIIIRTERSIIVAGQVMDRLREFVVSNNFFDVYEEILFFKAWKPRFYSKLIYCLRILKIESHKPFGNRQRLVVYYESHQNDIDHFIQNNLMFYEYYRLKATHCDEQYFRRMPLAMCAQFNSAYFNSDPRFSSPQDYTMAKILAYEMLAAYLEKCILHLQTIPPTNKPVLRPSPQSLAWTESKTSLIELIYALQQHGAFNSGKTDIRQIAAFFEKVFDVDLGNYYRVFQDIRIRKKNRTHFLDQLKVGLERKMDEADEHPKL